MVQVSLSTSTNFDGDNALIEDQGTELTVSLNLDEPAPAGGLRVFVDSDVEQIINRLDLPTFAFNPVAENIDPASVTTDFDNSGVAFTIDEGATSASFTIPIFDNPEPDTTLPETFDGLVEANLSLKTQAEVSDEDASNITGISEYTVDSSAASSVVLFADDESQLTGDTPTTELETSTGGYDEAVEGDISNDPSSPSELSLSEGTTTLSATTSDGDQEYVTVNVPEGFQLDTVVLDAFSESNVAFIGVQEGDTFTEPLDDSADTGNLLGYTLFGNPRQVGTDILDEIGNGLNAQGFEGALPSGTYTFASQQLGTSSDYTLDFNVSEATETPETETPETPTEEPTPEPETPGSNMSELPIVSFETVPDTLSEEAENNLVEWKWTVEGDFPESGITVNLDTSGGNPDIPFDFTNQFAAEPEAEFINAEIVDSDDETGRINILLSAPEASFKLYFIDDIIEEGTQPFDFELVEGEGYTVDSEQNGTVFTITDDNGGEGAGPTVGISASATELAEGDPVTIDFTVDGEIPEGGLQVLVQSPVAGALGQFDVSDLSTLELTGIEGVPEVADAGGSSFFVTITEPNASITTSVFDDIAAEEALEIPFEIINGEEYEVNPDAGSVTLNIADETAAAGPTVGLTVDKTDVTEGETITLTFNVDGEIPEGGVQVLVNDVDSAEAGLRSLTEFDVANIETTGLSEFPTPADGDSGFLVNITEPTATITLPVFDEGADEDESQESFTFEVIDGEAYQVNPDAGSITLNIADVGDTPGEPDPTSFPEEPTEPEPEAPTESLTAPEGESSNDTIATATPTDLTADNGTITIDGEIFGNFFDPDLSLRTDKTEDVDLYSVELAEGDFLQIDTDANEIDSEVDTLVRLFDVEGNAIAQNDDGFAPDELFKDSVGFDSYLEYTTETAGTYYAGVSSFSNGEVDFITDPYDPNVVGSGSGNSSDEYELNLSLNQTAEVEQTEIPPADGTGPTVSFKATPGTFDGDAIVTNALVQSVASDDEDSELSSVVTLQFSTEEEIPEGGVEIFLDSSVNIDKLFETVGSFFGRGVEVLGPIYDENGVPTGMRINLTANSALLTLNLESPETVPSDGTETLKFSLVPSAGYQTDASEYSTPIYDTIDDVPDSATSPTVSFTASETALVESTGNTTTLTFELSEAPPAEGILVYVDTETEAVLSEFNVFDAKITGADAPFPNSDVSGFYLRMTEQTATVTVSAFDETTNPQLTPEDALEGIESVNLNIVPGEGYTVAPDSDAIELTIADNPESEVIPDNDGGDGDSAEEGNENPEGEFNNTIDTAIATGLSAENSTYETLATLEAEDILLNPGVPEEEELYFTNLIDFTEDVDMYSFDLEAGQTITLNIEADGTGEEVSLLAPVLRVFDAAGEEQAIFENAVTEETVPEATNNASLEFIASTAGTYYAGVSVLGNTFYDANERGSGSGWIFEDQFEPGSYSLTAELGTDLDDPLVPVFGSINGDTIEVEGSNQLIFVGDMNDLVDASTGDGNNRIYAGSGDDTLILGESDRVLAGAGDDAIFTTSGGGNDITGGVGSDQFWIASAELPDAANIITDFTAGEDVIGIAGLGVGFADLSITNLEGDALISANDSQLAIIQGTAADSLSESDFAFG